MKQNEKTEMEFENQATENLDVPENESGSAESTEGAPDEIARLKAELQDLKDKYLRQVAEFDNFRKRNARERLDLIQTAGKDVIVSLLEVVDDCDRAEKQLAAADNFGSMKDGILLIFNKLRNVLQAKGLKAMQSVGAPFNPDQHEAITEVPTPNEDLKGKVIDEVEKGYYLNDKIIRFAKVVVGK